MQHRSTHLLNYIQLHSPHALAVMTFALEIAARPLGTSANFNPADGERYPGNLPVILMDEAGTLLAKSFVVLNA